MHPSPGSARDDHLEGTPGDDVICALSGDDMIDGGGGDDVLYTNVPNIQLEEQAALTTPARTKAEASTSLAMSTTATACTL